MPPQVSYVDVTGHALWPLRRMLVTMALHYPRFSRGRTRSSQLLEILRASKRWPGLDVLDERQFGMWFSLVKTLVERDLDGGTVATINEHVRRIREERRAVRASKGQADADH